MKPEPGPVQLIAGTLAMPPQSRIPFDRSATYATPPPPTMEGLAERLARLERAVGPIDEQGRLACLTTRHLRVVDVDGREIARLYLGDCGSVLQFLDLKDRVRVGVGMGDGEHGIAVFTHKGGRTWTPFSRLSSLAQTTWHRVQQLPRGRRALLIAGAALFLGIVGWLWLAKPLAFLLK